MFYVEENGQEQTSDCTSLLLQKNIQENTGKVEWIHVVHKIETWLV